MKYLVIAASVFPVALCAEQARSVDAHEHGSGSLGIAFSGSEFALSLQAPGADIVGFEHAPTDAKQRALVQAAISDLAKPLDLFLVPEQAECSVKSANVEVAGEHDEGHEAEHEHSKAETDHSEDPASGHNEFHAEYLISCRNIDAIDGIGFEYFTRFPNAQELDVQVATTSGARAYEVDRSAAHLDLRGMF